MAALGLTPRVLAALLVVVLVVAGGVIALGQGAFATMAPPPPAAASASPQTGSAPGGAGQATVSGQATVVVRPGDTLWSLARRMQPMGDVRPLVDQLVAANGGDAIAPGDRLVVPG